MDVEYDRKGGAKGDATCSGWETAGRMEVPLTNQREDYGGVN